MIEYSVARWIRGFGSDDRLVAEHPLPTSWTLAALQQLFGRPSDDPMCECYPIGIVQAAALGPSLGRSLVSKDIEYFLEVDAE